MQGLVTPQDQMQGGKRKRRSDSPGAWRKRRGDDMSEGQLEAQPPPKRSSNNKVLAPAAITRHPSTILDELGRNCVLTPSQDNCVGVYMMAMCIVSRCQVCEYVRIHTACMIWRACLQIKHDF